MRRILAALCLLFLAAFALADGSSYSMEVDVTPDGSGRANAFICNAVVADLETGAPVMMPKLSFLADSAATLSTKQGDREFVLTILVDSNTSKTTAELKVTRGGRLIAEQKTSMALHR